LRPFLIEERSVKNLGERKTFVVKKNTETIKRRWNLRESRKM